MKKVSFIGSRTTGAHDFLQKTADFLLNSVPEAEIPDLSRILIVLPGQNAIRLLSDRLAATGKGVFPPDTATSGGLIRFGIEEKSIDPAERTLIWKKILNGLQAEGCTKKLFPNGLDHTNSKLLTGLAENLSALQTELNRELLSFATAKDILQGNTDYDRWKALAELEQRFNAILEENTLPDPLLQLQNAVSDLTVFRQYDRIVIAGVPDLPGPALKRLELLEMTGTLPIDILVNAAPDMAIRFDPWGRVIPEAWSGYPLNFEQGGRNRIHIAADPADLARLTRELLPVGDVFDCRKTVIATADPALVPWIKRELENVPGMPEIYDPAGFPAGKLDLVPLLQLFCRLIGEPQIDVIRSLFAHRSFIAWLAAECATTENDLYAALDSYRLKHLVDVLTPQSPYAGSDALRGAFSRILKIRETLCSSTDPVRTLRELFNRIYQKTPSPLHGISFRQEAEKFSALLERFAKSSLLTELQPPEFYEVLARAAGKIDLYPEHSPDAVEITGFLDLPFRSAERIILCGMNEGALPESIIPTNFLNDTKRKILGLPDNAQRFARDCFYLYTILKDAPESEFIVCKTDEKGAPLRASTLFFAGSEHLEQRAKILFSPPPVPTENASGKKYRHFTIEPDLSLAFGNPENPEQIQLSVTSFRGLLDPKTVLDTFFERSMKLSCNDYETNELDPMAFGTVCHAALEHFDLNSCNSEDEAVDALTANFSRELTKKCGSPLPPAILVQKEMSLRRIAHTAKQLFAEKDHFDLLKQEWDLNGGNGIIFHDMLIKGKIDRIEISKDRTTLRLIDFKTSDKGKTPEETHYKRAGRGTDARFLDLQLPLYRLLLPLDETFWKDVGIDPEKVKFECGYFNIPKAVTETGYKMWQNMDLLLDQAERTVDQIREWILNDIRKARIADFTPDANSNFKEFYRPDPPTALAGISFDAGEVE
ncbi:MAG: PD-(D/E)XK nuclease family protein [Lentisphaeria bacterium]|nr:PD-(D/E)XK nuclease family protein [Lentisphaeria bacterium]